MEKLRNAAPFFLSVNPLRVAALIFAVASLCVWTARDACAGHPSWQGGDTTDSGAETAGSGSGSGPGAGAVSDSTEKPNYVQIPSMTIPIIGDSGVSQNVSLSVVIEATSVAAADDLRKKMPRLNDAYITSLYSLLNGHVAVREGVVQVGIVKKDLDAVSRKVVGDDKIKEILLQVVYQKRM